MTTTANLGLFFSGTEEEDPAWLHDKQGRVFVLDENEADELQRILYSGEEEIDVREYDGDAPTRGLED